MSLVKIKELTGERATILTQLSEMAAKVKAEQDRDLNPEERSQVERGSNRAREIDVEIATLQSDIDAGNASKRLLNETVEAAKRNPERRSSPPVVGTGKRQRLEETDEYRSYFDAAFRCDHRERFRAEQTLEQRAMSLGTNSAGGYMSLPTALMNEFISNVDELSGIMNLCTRVNIGDAKALGVSKITARGDDADWTSEITTVTADTNLAFGRRDFTPFMLTKEVLASMSLLQRSPQAQPIVMKQMARLFAVTGEKAVYTGTGSSQPLGIFVASASGVSTARDVTCASTTAFTYSELVQLKYNLKSVHLNSKKTRLFIHRDFAYRALTLLDGENRPIFVPSNDAGQVDRILGVPVAYSEFCPNTFTAAKYIAVIGDMDDYWIVDAMTYGVQIADQIAARTNQVSFLGRCEWDGAPILEEAFSRLITHA